MINRKVLELFADYHKAYPVWGAIHIVLEDGNVEDDHVWWCVEQAVKDLDESGHTLAWMLLAMPLEVRHFLFYYGPEKLLEEYDSAKSAD